MAYGQGVTLVNNCIHFDNQFIKGTLDFFPLDSKIAVMRLKLTFSETVSFKRVLEPEPSFYACLFTLKEGVDLHAFDHTEEQELNTLGLSAKHSALYFSADVQTKFTVVPNEETRIIIVVFTHDALDEIVRRPDDDEDSHIFLGETVKGYTSMSPEMIDKVTDILEYAGTEEVSGLYLLGAVYGLLAKLFLQIVTERHLLTELTGMVEVARMVQIRNFMVSDFSTECPLLDEMARRAQMSVTKFKTLFKKLFKLPYFQYYQRYRLLAARQNIIYGKSVSETAYEFGFNSVSNFSVAFKKMFNVSPSEVENHSDDLPLASSDM
jgi:AraC-like DNA-binding protein